jgi:magnesium-transporting ATPase (P-type)
MGLPLSYSIRNLWTRRLTTLLTASGMALVVFVFLINALFKHTVLQSVLFAVALAVGLRPSCCP